MSYSCPSRAAARARLPWKQAVERPRSFVPCQMHIFNGWMTPANCKFKLYFYSVQNGHLNAGRASVHATILYERVHSSIVLTLFRALYFFLTSTFTFSLHHSTTSSYVKRYRQCQERCHASNEDVNPPIPLRSRASALLFSSGTSFHISKKCPLMIVANGSQRLGADPPS